MSQNIPYNKQHIDKFDFRTVRESLSKNLITGGSFVKLLETKMKKFLSCKFALSCSSGTSAIHLALHSLNINKGDNFVIPSINFIASANMLTFMGANVYLSDVDESGQMTPELLEKCIKKNKIKKLKGFFTMYLGGVVKNVYEFYKIKKKYKCYLIEDACHAFGSIYFYNNKKYKIGSCLHSDICIFSFHAIKTITSGEGGLLTTNKKIFYNQAKYFRSHGIKRKSIWDYDIEKLGFNYRLSDINASLACSQLSKIKIFINKRKIIVNKYLKELNFGKKLRTQTTDKFFKNSANHLFIVFFNNRKTRDKYLRYMLKKKINININYKPIYLFNLYKDISKPEDLKGAKKYFDTCASLPIFYSLKNFQQKKIITLTNKFIQNI